MKVCILGNGLTSLTLAKSLINQGLKVDLFCEKKIQNYNKTRTIGLSKSNIEFFNKNILNIEKLLWDIKKIEVFSEKLKNKKIIDFENNNQRLFSIIKNHQLINHLLVSLKKDKLFSFKHKISNYELLKKNYKIIINCEFNNKITKKYFFKKIDKDYKSRAYTTIINHKKLKNDIAYQVFTIGGPIAFLPLSNNQTSVVFSLRNKNYNFDIKSQIKKYNFKYENIKLQKIDSFELKSLNLRTYHYKNILAFGDLLHKIHPLAGQGFNISIRDIKELTSLVKFKIDLGLDLDNSICEDFESRTRHKNYLFTSGIDFIYEFFKLESRSKNSFLSNTVKFLGKNKSANKLFSKVADNGIIF